MNKQDILKTARRRMDEAITADRDNREADMDDLEKLVGIQWPDEIRAEREAENKPCLTMNRLPQFVRQVTGDIRRMNPAIKVLPADQEASQESADLIEGLIRQIEYASDASSVYEQTAESAAACSIGWFRVLTDWEDDKSFNQEIRIKRIRNVFSVYCDPAAEMPTREDANYIFVTESMAEDDFRDKYPKASTEDATHDGSTDGLEHWREGGKVIVAEYFWKEPVQRTIHLMADGTVVDGKDFVAPMNSVRKRTVNSHKIMWAKISGSDVLEGPTEQAGMHIPVIAVTGEEWAVGDRVHRSSVIRYAKDAQQMYNYWRSAQTEFAALQPKAPYLITAKQVAGYEEFWNEANSKNRPYLPYHADPAAPPPQRMQPPMTSQAMFEQTMSAAEDLKATTGIYDAGLGDQGNEKSGVAIRQRQMESDVSTSIYADNMAKAIAHCGRLIVDLIPSIYDTQRIIRIIGDDEQEQMVPINGQMMATDPMTGQLTAIPQNDLTIGKYDIRVAVGPNYSTRRQETREGMIDFVKAFPNSAPIVGDLVAKAMEWPDADKFAERLKKALPPGFVDPKDMSPEEQQQWQMQQDQQQAAQQEAQDAARAQMETELRKAGAEASEADSDAQKAAVEAAQAQFELAVQTGQMDAAIAQIVQREVARVLQGTMQQGQPPLI